MKTFFLVCLVLSGFVVRGEAACATCGGAVGGNPAQTRDSAPFFRVSVGTAQQGQSAGHLTFGTAMPDARVFQPTLLGFDAFTRPDVIVVTTNVVTATVSSTVEWDPQVTSVMFYVTNDVGTNVMISAVVTNDLETVAVTNWTTTYTTNAVIRQVDAPQALADIPPPPTTNGYVINFYFPANVGVPDGSGAYAVSGTPFATWVVTNPSPTDISQIQVSDYTAADGLLKQWTCSYSTNSGAWTRQDLAGIQETMTTTNLDATTPQIINTFQYASGPVVQQTKTTYGTFSWGVAPVEVDAGAGSDIQTTTYTYYDPSPAGTMALKESVVNPDGSQQYFAGYDTNGNPTNVYSTFQDDATGRQTVYLYDPVAAGVSSLGDNGSVNPYTPRETTEFIEGTEASCSYSIFPSAQVRLDILCTKPYPNDNWNNANNLVTTNLFYTNGPNQGALAAVIRPDKTMTIYNYITNNNYQTNITVSGQPDPAYGYIVDGISNVMVLNQWGYPVVKTSWDVKSDILVSQDTYGNYDNYGRPQQVAHLDGTIETNIYTCCGLQNHVDRDGLNTVFLYDSARRQYGSEKYYGSSPVTYQNTLDAVGRVLQTDRIGTDSSDITQSRMGYDPAGELIAETNALGGVTTHSRANDPTTGGLIRTTVYPDGGTRVDAYYADGRLKSTTGTGVHGQAYSYGTATDANGNACTYVTVTKLDATGSPTSEAVQSYADMAGRSTETLYADGNYSQMFYNGLGQLFKQVDPDGYATLYQYDAKGQRSITAVAMNNLAETSPDFSNDHITWATNFYAFDHGTYVQCAQNYAWAASGTSPTLMSFTESSVDGLNTWQTTYRDASVAVTNHTQTIPGASRVVTSTAPDNSYSISDYLYGQLASVTHYDATGTQVGGTSYAYDAHERQSAATDARNGATSYVYNNADEASSVTTPAPGNGPAAETTTTTYDSLLRPVSVVQPDGTAVNTAYRLTGEKGLEYGSRTYPVGYDYDYAGRMASMTNWSGFASSTGARVTKWTYDAERGWLTGKTYADGHGPSYSYTPAGRLASRTWVRGVTTDYLYDPAGSLTNLIYSDTTPGVTNAYDRLGRLASVASGGMTDTLTYNLAGEVLAESFAGGPLAGLSVTNGYDQWLRRTNLTALAASVLSRTIYGYDDASRLATVSDGTDSAAYSYLANSPLVGQIVFQQSGTTRMTTTKQYDYLSRLTQISSAPTASGLPPIASAYSYNSANQRTKNTLADGSYWSYRYDPLGQVTSGRKFWADGTVVAGQQFGYAFDDIGNRTQTQTGGDEHGQNLRVAAYYANSLNQVTNRDVPGYVEVQGVSFATNIVAVNGLTNTYRKAEYFRQEVGAANGPSAVWTNLTVTAPNQASTTGNAYVAQQPESFQYDADGNLTNDGRWYYAWDAENRLIGMTVNTNVGPQYHLTFAYDAKGRRIQKIAATNGVVLFTNNFLYDGWNLVAETGTNNTLIRNYIWGNDLSGSPQGAGGVGGLLLVTYHSPLATTNAFVAFDGNGNVSALVNAADGTTLANYDYGPFGETIRSTGPFAKSNPIRFSTKFQDDESDMVYYGRRYYKASTGTWINRDPIEEKGGLNVYEFVSDSPANLFDSLGLRFGDGKICGNYCGGGYCGGKRLKPGEKCDFNVPPTDALDSCCKTHDQCYDDVAAGKTTKAACDSALCQCSKIARLYRRSCDNCEAIAFTTVPIWSCYLTGR